ncbi:related to Cuticle-degrading protease [Lecanosticta acicola]|uniref:Related to Cuticle-degrading protease n=1 Tax=Lecanosticta acicola TaxID=111012 RepID=A0AAI9EAB1_9PEZI|nr:related to Cuticle-degrading protease [Lecanosticta acicola]
MRYLFTLLAVIPASLALATIDRRQTPDAIPDSWIVTFKQDTAVSDALAKVLALANVKPAYTYDSVAFKGFSFRGTDTNGLLNLLASVGAIQNIEPDRKVYLNAPVDYIEKRARYVSQRNAPWGLARISKRTNDPAVTSYTYDSTYQGRGVYAYVLDTGINFGHQDFGGRAVSGANYINSSLPAQDDNGHGTHVSGIIGGSTYGVAKQVNLIAVKVLDASGVGDYSGVLAAMDWVVNDATSKKRRAVANMSLGSGYYEAVNTAVANAVKAGVFFAIAAGNSNHDAALDSPASTPEACVIGASDNTDTRASFSNFGSLVDIFAPGVNILSTWIGSNTATATLSGTSMATPHAAGVAAFLLGQGVSTTAINLCSLIQSYGTMNVIQNAGVNTTTTLLNNPWPGEK